MSQVDAAAAALYRAVFRNELPEALFQPLRAALRDLAHHADASEYELSMRLATLPVDIEALELAARWTGRLPTLVRAVRATVYVGEAWPHNQGEFVGGGDGMLLAVLRTLVSVGRSGLILVKGLLLLGRVARA